MKFEKLPELLQAKMKQHHKMVEDCKERNYEIRKLFERRRSEAAADAGHARGAQEDLEDARTERTASRLRHCLASLKASLQYDDFELQRQHDQAVRQKQVCHVMCVCVFGGSIGGHLRAHGLAALDSDALSPLPLHSLLSKYSTTRCLHIHTEERETVRWRGESAAAQQPTT
jgi:hypothetical protein